VAELLDNFNEQLLDKLHRNPVVREAFENSKKIAGYEAAKKAWLLTNRCFWHKHHFKKLTSLEEKSSIAEAREFFFHKVRIDPPKALKENHWLVTLAAQEGDTEFFRRIVSEMRKAKRNKPRDMLEGAVLVHWIPCCLWLASDHAASTYLQQVTGKAVQENAYAKARQRLESLGLVNYRVAYAKPLIVGCTRNATFIFAKGWTNMDSTLS
jgi:hypothetical protein